MTLMSLLVLVVFLYIGTSSPFLIAVLFVVTLTVSSLLVAIVDSFLGLIVFVVYVGGALVLFSYCFMLTPLQESRSPSFIYGLPIILLCPLMPPCSHGSLCEFYWVASLLISVGVLLLIVILCVVSLVDFSQGAIRVL